MAIYGDLAFPMPFQGLRATGPLTEGELAIALVHLRDGCGQEHAHNFLVQMEDTPSPRLWLNSDALGCVAEALL